MAKTKIGIITYDFPPAVGGIGKNLQALQKKVNEKTDFPYMLLALSPNINSLANHQTILAFTRRFFGTHLLFSVFLNLELNKLIKKESLAALILPGGPGGVFLFQRLRVPHIYIANHTYQQQISALPNESWKKIFLPSEKWGYQTAKRIIAISSTTKASLVEDYGIDEGKIDVIPPGLLVSNTASVTIEKEPGSLLFVGRLDSRKGFNFLFDAVALLGKQNTNFKLHVVGSGKNLGTYKNMCKNLKLTEHITFHGNLAEEKLNELYQRCQIQIVPSKLEGFGIAAIEGMSHNACIIASNVAGLTDIIKHENNGLLVEYGNVPQLATSIERLINDSQLRNKLISNAKISLARYDWEQLLELYKDCFGKCF